MQMQGGLKLLWFEPGVWIGNHATLGALSDLGWSEAMWKGLGWRGAVLSIHWLGR